MAHDTQPKQLRSFGLLVGGIFAVMGLWPPVVYGEDPRWWALGLGGVLMVPALLWPKSLGPAYRVWMALGEGLGWINTRIILGIVYYGLFTPMGLLRRLRGQDMMRRRWEPTADTYRQWRQPRPRSHMTRQF